MNSSALQVPVTGILVQFDATKAWLENSNFDRKPTVTCKIAYSSEEDQWHMVNKDDTNSVVTFVEGMTESTRYIRITRIGKTGKFVHAAGY